MTRYIMSGFLALLVVVFWFPLVRAFAQQPAYQVGVIPPEPPPSIPPGDDIIIYVHGGPGSRLEEAGDLVNPFLAAGIAKGKRYTIISFDQPSQGYSSMIDPTSVNPLNPCNPLNPTSTPSCGLVPDHDQIHNYYPLLAASDEFIVAALITTNMSPPRDKLGPPGNMREISGSEQSIQHTTVAKYAYSAKFS